MRSSLLDGWMKMCKVCLNTRGSRIAADAADADAKCFNRVPKMQYWKRIEILALVLGFRGSIYTVQGTQTVKSGRINSH